MFFENHILHYLWFVLLNVHYRNEKPDIYEGAKCGDSTLSMGDYGNTLKCFTIEYSQSIALTAVNTILPLLFTRMILLEG